MDRPDTVDAERSLTAGPIASAVADGLHVIAHTASNLALQDWAIVALHGVLTLAAWLLASGPQAASVRFEITALSSAVALMLVLTRGELVAAGPGRAISYRLGMLTATLCSYLVLRQLLPALHPILVDTKLLALDTRLFGQTPAAWLDRFVTPTSVEWFAFFYYLHYALIASYVIGTLVFDHGRRHYELLLSTALLAAIGHSLYMLVPGAGPYAEPSLSFAHALRGGIWWGRVNAAVSGAGAGLDIFPSMHTGLSLLIALHAVRHRREPPISWIWLPTCFIVANIIVATVFLRWHYGIDVIVGALLAIATYRFAVHAWRWECARGERQAVWEPVLPRDMDVNDRRWLTGVTLIQLAVVAALLMGMM
jgi:PAP2 superfamily